MAAKSAPAPAVDIQSIVAAAVAQALSAVQTQQSTPAAAAEPSKPESKTAFIKQVGTRTLTFKVNEKGTGSLYGLGHFPVSLYGEQWIALLAAAAEISKVAATMPKKQSK